MAFRLQKSSIKAAIQHLARYGDTDVFPRLFEISFFADEIDALADELSDLDLDTYEPAGALEAIAPKSKLGFRVVHQLTAIDTLLFLASTIEIGDKIEAFRSPASENCAFSYRFKLGESGAIFQEGRTYKDWLLHQHAVVSFDRHIKTVVSTDISDFYARINFHRIENLLSEAAENHGASKFIKRQISKLRAKQSFGLPVGGSAARLLAELALVDTDTAIASYGVKFSRFVDDFRLFLTAQQDPYEILAFLAKHLSVNEGLSLNASKTYIRERTIFLTKQRELTTDIDEEVEGIALDSLTASVYFDDDPDPDDIEKLKAVNLLHLLQEELDNGFPDVGRIKVIFRALKIATPEEAIDFISVNISELLTFSKEVVLLMEGLDRQYVGCFEDATNDIIDQILSPQASNILVIRSWLLELFVRGIVPITSQDMRRLDTLSSPMDRRQLALIRGLIKDKNFFREQKTSFSSLSIYEKSCAVAGASCLPADEYDAWIKVIRPHFTQKDEKIFLKWTQSKRALVLSPRSSHDEDGDE